MIKRGTAMSPCIVRCDYSAHCDEVFRSYSDWSVFATQVARAGWTFVAPKRREGIPERHLCPTHRPKSAIELAGEAEAARVERHQRFHGTKPVTKGETK